MLKAKIRKRRVDSLDELYGRLADIGLFELYPDLGNIEDSYENSLKKELNTLEDKFKVLKETGSNKSHLWIGINPPPDNANKMKILHDLTLRVVEKYSWLKNSAWCIEAHTPGGYRPHIHMMVDYIPSMTPRRVIKQLAYSYKINENSIECKPYKNGHLWGEHLDYIQGNKKDDKFFFISRDISERKENKIQNFYLNGIYKDANDSSGKSPSGQTEGTESSESSSS